MALVKICGIRTLDEAKKAVSYGVDALGFHVGEVKGSRSIVSSDTAHEIITKLPASIIPVLVTTSSKISDIEEIVKTIGARAVQFHDDATTKEISRFKKELPEIKAWKVIHVQDEMAIEDAKLFASVSDAILLDSASHRQGQIGGTGKTHDWEISAKIVRSISLPIILAGGLNPDNVADAIEKVHPYMVDVNSGVSRKNGTKDLDKVRAFIKRAKS